MPLYIDVVNAARETTVKILARRANRAWNVIVTTDGGSTASVRWEERRARVTLNMPALPPDSVMTRNEADRLVAYIAHECCHVLHSSWHYWQQAVASGDRVRHWTNALEDVRIEAKEIRAGNFPALRDLLATLCTAKHFEAMTDARKHGQTIGRHVANTPYVVTILGRMANKYDIPSAKGFAGTLSPNVRTLVNFALTKVKGCKDTADVLCLARELVAMEAALPQPQQPQPQDAPGEAQEGEEGQDGPGAPQEGEEGQDGPGAPQEGEEGQDAPGEPQEGEEGQDAPGEPQEGEEGQDAPGEAISPDHDLGRMIDDVAARNGIPDLAKNNQGDRSHELNTLRTQVSTLPANGYNQTGYASQLDGRLPGSSVLHGQIARLLVSDEVHRKTHHEMSGRLDRRALVRMRTGAPDVYSRRDDTPGMDTAVLILIDGSSSMDAPAGDGTRMAMAQTTAWHIAKAAEMADAKVSIAVFETNRASPANATVFVVKPWETSVASCAHALAGLDPFAYTPMSPAIIACAGMLADVSATRRILLVLTDGDCDYHTKAVSSACRIASDLGVETVGIGMNAAQVIDAFPPRYSVNVSDLGQLATTGLGVLTDMLEDHNPRGAD
jgi:Mg-chelatase subunit ChlD